VARPGSRAGSSAATASALTIQLGWPVLAGGAVAAVLLLMALLMPPPVALYMALCLVAGTGITYLGGLPLRLEERLAFGMVIGAMAATVSGFLVALLAGGLGVAAVLAGLTAALAASAPGWLRAARGELAADAADLGARWRQSWPLWGLLAVCWAFALYYLGGGYQFTSAGLLTTGNGFYGDWAAHLAYTGSFAYGQNFPPEFPVDPGHRLAYPFMVDFFAASLVSLGASLTSSLVLSSGYLALALPAIVALAGARLVGSLAAGAAGCVVFLLGGGGLGFLNFLSDVDRLGGAALQHIPRFYTMDPDRNYQWMNPVLAYLIPQRSILFGLAVALVVAALLWMAREHGRWPAYALAGGVAGLAPLFHLHGYGTAVAIAVFWALFDRRPAYLAFFAPALVLGLPVVAWTLGGGTADVRWLPGWLADLPPQHDGGLWFWLKNSGLFIPSMLAAQIWAGTVPGALAARLAPIWLWFLVPNFVVFQPWEWDNTKFLVFWSLFGSLLVGALLVRLAGRGVEGAVIAGLLALVLCASGGLDLARALDRSQLTAVFVDSGGLAAADWTRTHTEPRAVFAAAPDHNEPVAALGGRRVVAGYGGWLWTYGLADWTQKTEEEKRILAGDTATPDLVAREHVSYVVIGPQELTLGASPDYWAAHGRVVYQAGGYTIYKV
jgi:hypothetical protein